jgi:hypothetical protein
MFASITVVCDVQNIRIMQLIASPGSPLSMPSCLLLLLVLLLLHRLLGSKSFAEDEAIFKEVHRRLINKEDLPEFEPVQLSLQDLLAEGRRLVAEQDAVMSAKLSEEYMRGTKRSGKPVPSLLGLMG